MIKIKNGNEKLKAVLTTSTTDHYSTLLAISKIKNRANLSKAKTIIDFETALKQL